MNPLRLAALLTALMSLAAFAAFGAYKRFAAKKMRRIPERTLLLLCLLMGAAGGLLAMGLFRHKTRQPKFRFGVPVCLALNIAVRVIIAVI